jgi:hypothetical protein
MFTIEARREDQRQAAEQREDNALAALLPVLSELQASVTGMMNVHYNVRMGLVSPPVTRADAAYRDMLQASTVQLPPISDPEFRERYGQLMALVDELAEGKVQPANHERAGGDVISYIKHIRYSVKRLRQHRALPQGPAPPRLNRVGDMAQWAPVESDPEDV